MVKGPRRRPLPLGPLLDAFLSGDTAQEMGPSVAAPWLTVEFLDTADDAALATALATFHAAVHPLAFHPPTTDRRIRFLRHALNHLLRGQDPLPDRLARCLTPGGAYHVPGLGPTFWTAVVKAIDPAGHPLWCPAIERGLEELGLVREWPSDLGPRFAAVIQAYATIRDVNPSLTTAQIDRFLERVARMTGRELPADPPADPAVWTWQPSPARVKHILREVRTATPLRKRLRDAAGTTIDALKAFQAAARAGEYPTATEAFRGAFPDGRWEHALSALDDAYSPTLDPTERATLVRGRGPAP
jgi:hypothetical protein